MPKEPIPPFEHLIEQLHGKDWTGRCDAVRLLGQSRDPRAVEALLPDLSDSDWRVRRNAAQALGALRDKRAVGSLLQALKGQKGSHCGLLGSRFTSKGDLVPQVTSINGSQVVSGV